MKKILSMIMLTIITLVLMAPVEAYAYDRCDNYECDTTQASTEKKSDAFTRETNKLLEPVKKYGESYSWTTKTKVTKKTSRKVVTKVYFRNVQTGYRMTLYIHATKKDGKVTAKWYFRRDGKWVLSSSSLIKGVLEKYGAKLPVL